MKNQAVPALLFFIFSNSPILTCSFYVVIFTFWLGLDVSHNILWSTGVVGAFCLCCDHATLAISVCLFVSPALS